MTRNRYYPPQRRYKRIAPIRYNNYYDKAISFMPDKSKVYSYWNSKKGHKMLWNSLNFKTISQWYAIL